MEVQLARSQVSALALAGAAACLLAALPVCPAHACELNFNGPAAVLHQVASVIDARTLALADRSELRLAAILPPTRFDSPAGPADWPPEVAARRALQTIAERSNLRVARERDIPDRYGRIVGHAERAALETSEGPADRRNWLQAELVAAGHARVAPTPETTPACVRALLTLEAAAERDRRGLWREALYQPKPAGNARALLAYRSTYQIVVGTVRRVAVNRSTVYLNFADDWQRDFTARISRGVLKRAGIDTKAVEELEGRPLRVRGWIERRRGPLISVWRTEQVELLDPASVGAAPRRRSPPALLSDLATGAFPGDHARDMETNENAPARE